MKHHIAALMALALVASGGLIPAAAATTKVAALHPLIADLARQVGGEHVEVVDLMGEDGDPHHFEPSPDDIRRADGAVVYFASGMGMESYLPKLRGILEGRATIIEIGATLPGMEGNCDSCGHDHQHAHDHGLDPHWWHSVDLFRRATTIMANALAESAPEHAGAFRANALAYRERLDDLEAWAKREISKVPRDRRRLATAHAAFNYFCRDFGFTAYPLQGINREQLPTARQFATVIEKLRNDRVGAIFPEKVSNPKILETLTNDTGIKLGRPLMADGGVSYEEMMRHNVAAIVEGLADPAP